MMDSIPMSSTCTAAEAIRSTIPSSSSRLELDLGDPMHLGVGGDDVAGRGERLVRLTLMANVVVKKKTAIDRASLAGASFQ